ncbi:AraC family transcriptional regulator [Massilibacteroides sp.]|uniref:AraC family transcriptional regulator n=1 Tax=Massilibacteroides sp. TaxID=2034766 RepID=UPI00262F25C2|nr:AraC family transcriptional regulator [Massilibacteroides sp.]MDD4515833.1 AraC family transcriptional regulator [Massilibacteroides sp.]
MKNRFMHEQLPINEYNPIIARNYDYNRFTYPWHFHSEYEIIYIKEGYGEYFVADQTGTFNSGDIFFLGSNLPHYMRSAPDFFLEENTMRVKGVVVQFQKEFMTYAIENYMDLKPIKDLFEQSKRGILFSCSSNSVNKELIERVEILPQEKGINRFTTLLLLLDAMAKHKNKKVLGSRQFNNSLSLFSDNRLEKILSFVNYHYAEKIELETVAAMIPMNVTAFCRYFKEKTGKTFMDYILDLRIGYACKLLSGKQMDVSEICLSSGFNSITHFNRVFKRKTGLTPSDYRQQFLQHY